MNTTFALSSDRAPDFTLPDHAGGSFHLAEPRGGATVLVFYRGHWCPYCRRYLTKLKEHWPRFQERAVTLAAISPEPAATSRALASSLGLPFPLLSDTTGAVIELYGVRNGFAAARSLLPHPAVFILDTGGSVRFRSIDRNFKKRTTIRTILHAIDAPGAG